MNFQLQLNLKLQQHSHLPVFHYLHLQQYRTVFVVAYYRSDSFIYTRYTIAVCTSNGNYDALNLKPQVHTVFVTIYVIYSNYRLFLLALEFCSFVAYHYFHVP